jgi:hypothetical protein
MLGCCEVVVLPHVGQFVKEHESAVPAHANLDRIEVQVGARRSPATISWVSAGKPDDKPRETQTSLCIASDCPFGHLLLTRFLGLDDNQVIRLLDLDGYVIVARRWLAGNVTVGCI